MLLLDTCTLLWLVQDYRQLPGKVQSIMEKRQGAIYVSAITAFEIGIKHQKRKLSLPLKPAEWYDEALEFHNLTELALTSKVLFNATTLPQHHNDPADRILIATAAFHKLTLLTPDPEIRRYAGIKILW